MACAKSEKLNESPAATPDHHRPVCPFPHRRAGAQFHGSPGCPGLDISSTSAASFSVIRLLPCSVCGGGPRILPGWLLDFFKFDSSRAPMVTATSRLAGFNGRPRDSLAQIQKWRSEAVSSDAVATET
jgi:hypothetical protein